MTNPASNHATNDGARVNAETRNALLFSDQNMTVFRDDWPMEKIENERKDADLNSPRSEWTKIVRVRVEFLEVVFDPATVPQVEVSEVEKLRAENSRLRAALATRTSEPSV